MAIYRQSFPLLCVAALFQGMQAAFFWYFRLAAADATEPAFRAKAISLVMAGGVLAGFLGPQVAKWSVDWLAPVTFAGIYVAMAGFSIAVLALVQLVRIPGLSAADRATQRPADAGDYAPARLSRRAGSIRVRLCGDDADHVGDAAGYAACGFGFSDSATVIQAHIVAMFLPSFFTGHLINRFGVLPVIAAGGLIEVGCALVNLAGVDFGNFLVANVLVGLGWNFAYVGGSTLLTSTYTPAERAKVQASHDFTVYAATASAAALSGVLAAKAGWVVINLAALPSDGHGHRSRGVADGAPAARGHYGAGRMSGCQRASDDRAVRSSEPSPGAFPLLRGLQAGRELLHSFAHGDGGAVPGIPGRLRRQSPHPLRPRILPPSRPSDLLAHGYQVLIQTAAGAGQFPFLVEDSLMGFIEQSSRFLKPVYAGDTLYPRLVVSELKPQRTTGVLTLAQPSTTRSGSW